MSEEKRELTPEEEEVKDPEVNPEKEVKEEEGDNKEESEKPLEGENEPLKEESDEKHKDDNEEAEEKEDSKKKDKDLEDPLEEVKKLKEEIEKLKREKKVEKIKGDIEKKLEEKNIPKEFSNFIKIGNPKEIDVEELENSIDDLEELIEKAVEEKLPGYTKDLLGKVEKTPLNKGKEGGSSSIKKNIFEMSKEEYLEYIKEDI